MLWNEFYDKYSDWSNDIIKYQISCLESIGSGDEIVDVILEIEDLHIRELLIRKSMNMNAQFTIDNFQDLLDELSDSLYEQMGYYTGYDHNDPFFDEENMEWDDFYTYYEDWREEILLRRIQKLNDFGPLDELCEVLENLQNPQINKLLYNRAAMAGVNFSPDINWSEFYEKFYDWSDTIKEKRISCLKNMGSSDEIIDLVLQTENMSIREQLIQKAIQIKVIFSLSDFQSLDGNLTDDFYRQLCEYAGFDYKAPYFDEDNMSWADFYYDYKEWSQEILHRRVHKLKDFGPSKEICMVIQDMEDSALGELLYESAVNAGIRFTEEEFEDMGIEVEPPTMILDEILEKNFSHEAVDAFAAKAEALVTDYEREKRRSRRLIKLGAILGLFSNGDRRRRR